VDRAIGQMRTFVSSVRDEVFSLHRPYFAVPAPASRTAENAYGQLGFEESRGLYGISPAFVK
jgi:hypothetical protein